MIFWLVGTPPVGVGISADALLPLGAIAVGVAIGLIQIYNTARNKAYDVQYDALIQRLEQCERYRDADRAKLEACRNALIEAHARIAELEAKYERGQHAGP